MFRVLIAALVAVLVGGCGASAPPSAAPPDASGVIIGAEGLHQVETARYAHAASVRRVTYVSKSGVDDAYTHVTTSIYVPRGPVPPGGFPVIAYGRAVDGTAPDCAFSSSTAVQRSTAAIDTFLKAGYVVTVPDYQGLGKPSDGKVSYHPYLDSASAGYNLIDAVRAARNVASEASSTWLVVGEGQGGQGAWAANELNEAYGDPHLRGTVSVTPTADMDGLVDAAAAGTLTPVQQKMYIEYLAALATEYGSRFSLDDYRRGVVKDNWSLLLGCTASDDAQRSAVFARIGPDDLRPATPQAGLVLQGYLRKTTLPQGPAGVPMLVVYDEQDPLTPPAWTQLALLRACHMGDAITIREQDAPSVFDPVVLDWVAGRAADTAVPDDCPAMMADNPLPPAPPPSVAPPEAPPSPAPSAEGAADQVPHDAGTEVSLVDGWLPVTIQVVAAGVLLAAIGRRSRRWRRRALPIAFATGAALIPAVWWLLESQGWGPSYPWVIWPWIGLTGVAIAVLVLGWPRSPWWRRAVALAAVPLCVLATGAALNASLSYLPTTATAWLRLTGRQPSQWIDFEALQAMRRDGARPTRGTVVSITTPNDVSGFSHRTELVYVPPVWFTSNPPPRLPVVMMIGPELSSPADWLLSARGLDILDRFALRHRGAAPLVVFPDTSGSFTNDTECVNGPRGNAADHITKEFVPHVISNFGASAEASGWAAAGWSSGGTCSVMLLVRHPELFGTIVDLDGQLGPNAGPRNQTIARLFGGDAQAWAAFDPKTVVQAHGPYRDKAAWIGVSADIPTTHFPASSTPPSPDSLEDWNIQSEDHPKTAVQMCTLLAGYGIDCSVVGYPGGHDYRSAAGGFEAALPWLAGRLATPGVPVTPLPGS